jgi:hypothetical protein
MTKAAQRAEFEAVVAQAVRRVSGVEEAFGHFADLFPGTDGSLSERALRGLERMDDAALSSAIDQLGVLGVVAGRAAEALAAVRRGPAAFVIRAVDKGDGAFRFATNLRPGFAPTVTREVRYAKRYLRRSSAERALAAFLVMRGHDLDGFEVVPDGVGGDGS